MSGLSFADVQDDSILVYLEDHGAFQTWITEQTGGGSDQVKVDLDKQQITFIPRLHKREEVVARIHLLGSVAAEPRSALWAWANPAFTNSPVVQMSTRVRDFGAAREIPEFTNAELPIPPDQEGSDRLTTYATTMAAVSCRITEIPTAHILHSGGTRVVMLVDAAGFAPPRPNGIGFPHIVLTAISAPGWIHDHRRAVQGYAQARNLPYGWEPNFTALNIGFPEGNVRVAFTETGLVGDVQTQFTPPPPPS